jgi:hypothetical protein
VVAWGVAREKTESALVLRGPFLSMVLGHVGDTGELGSDASRGRASRLRE